MQVAGGCSGHLTKSFIRTEQQHGLYDPTPSIQDADGGTGRGDELYGRKA